MSEHGLRIITDPRWIVVLPGQDVVSEVAQQLGVEASNAEESPENAVAGSITAVLQESLDDGAWWASALAIAEGDAVVLVRAALEWTGPADEDITANDIYDVLSHDAQDSDYATQLDLVSTPLGTAVAHRQVIVFDDGSLGDYLGFSIPYAGGVLSLRTFSTATGWLEFFAPMVESMLLSLLPDSDAAFGQVALLSYELAGDDR